MIVANVDRAGLMHTPQSVLRVVDKLPSGGVVMMLGSTSIHTGSPPHRVSDTLKLELGENGVSTALGQGTSAGVVHDYRHPTVRGPESDHF